jgi:hypothetical protein
MFLARTFASYSCAVVLAAGAFACSSNGQVAPVQDDGGTGDDSGLVQPGTESCTGDATRCLSGTVKSKGFTATPTGMKVELFHVFPFGTVTAVQSVLVAEDGTFAFNNLDPWAHYYAQAIAKFGTPDAGAAFTAVGRIVGPLSVPSAGQPIAISIVPAQLEVLESKAAGAVPKLQWASAHVFDPGSGIELVNASVSIQVGNSSTAMPYATNIGGSKSYFALFTPAMDAAQSYTITASHASFGASPVSWQVVADPPSYDAALSAPADGASIVATQPLLVSWPAQPLADYVVVELFSGSGGNYETAYASQRANPPDTTQETIPASAITAAGPYLLNVEVAKASCPAAADGCVYGSAVATASLTAH